MEVFNQMKVRFFIWMVLFVVAFVPSSLFAPTPPCHPCPTPPIPACAPPCPAPSTSSGGTQFEISPYGGYVWSGGNSGVGSLKNNQILGVRGGGYVTHAFEIGGNWYWNNHFQPESDNVNAAFAGALGFPQAAVRANLWEVEFTYNFGRRSLFGSTAVRPYLVASGGGITTNLKNGDVFVLNTRSFDVPGVSPGALRNALQNGNLQNVLQNGNQQNVTLQNGNLINALQNIDPKTGAVLVGTPTGTTVFVANTVMDNRTFFTFSYGGGLKTQRV